MNLPRSLFFCSLTLVLFGAGCLGGSSTASKSPDGGVFRLTIATATWKQLKPLHNAGKWESIAGYNILSLATDPQDANVLYAGTDGNGLIYSLDGGESWNTSRAPEVNVGRIAAIGVSAKDKCTVFAARSNQILKTSNCMRDWSQVFFDPRTDKAFTALAIDWFNPNTIYAGTSEGDVYRSQDGGKSWSAIQRAESRVTAISIHPKDSRVIYIGTYGAGLLKTIDGGAKWDKLTKSLQEFDGARRISGLAVDPLSTDTLYITSKYGLLKTIDGGASWQSIPLLTQPGTVEPRGIALHPANNAFLTYVTDSSLVISTDGGKNWTSKKLPTARGASALLFDKATPPNLLLGAYAKPN